VAEAEAVRKAEEQQDMGDEESAGHGGQGVVSLRVCFKFAS
jgi:hypothetical protein